MPSAEASVVMRVIVTASIMAGVLCSLAVPASGLGSWTAKAPMPYARSEVGVAQLEGRIYVIGGFGAGADQRVVQVYDVAADSWTTVAPLPVGLNHAGAVALAGKIYVIGGFLESGGASADCFAYDPSSNKWSKIAPLPSPRGSPAVAALNGVIHSVGGNDRGSIAAHDVYDPAHDTWASRAPLPIGRDHLALVADLATGKLYAFGGRIGTYAHNTDYVEAYDSASDTWAERSHMPTARSGIAAALVGGRIYVIGGENPRGVFTQVEAYDPIADRWSQAAPLPQGRHGTGAVTVKDSLYLPAGGAINGGSQPTNTLWVLAP
jgi:N-acetylneuraminic acid mutarotase